MVDAGDLRRSGYTGKDANFCRSNCDTLEVVYPLRVLPVHFADGRSDSSQIGYLLLYRHSMVHCRKLTKQKPLTGIQWLGEKRFVRTER